MIQNFILTILFNQCIHAHLINYDFIGGYKEDPKGPGPLIYEKFSIYEKSLSNDRAGPL